MKFKHVLFCFLLIVCATAFSQPTEVNWLHRINQGYNPSGGKVMLGFTHSIAPLSMAVPLALFTASEVNNKHDLKWKAAESIAAVGLATVTSTGLKYAFNRARPFAQYPDLITDYTHVTSPSFPSGHASISFALATNLSLMFPKWYVIAPAYAWAVTVAYSRMYLGVHYPSDVLAGALIGTFSAVASHYLIKRWHKPALETATLW